MRLRVQPRLASWMASGRPDQVRLDESLADAYELLRQRLDVLSGPLALRLDVGLPSKTPLLEQHDLDNYLFPLATRLSKLSGRQFVSVWGTKRHAGSSYITVAQAVPIAESMLLGRTFEVRTTASTDSTAFKEQIHQQLAGAGTLAEGPVSLHLCFATGLRRSWPNLWKPTIDALDQLLGRTAPDRPWHPCDGRIVELGLSNHADAALGNDVVISMTASIAGEPAPNPYPGFTTNGEVHPHAATRGRPCGAIGARWTARWRLPLLGRANLTC